VLGVEAGERGGQTELVIACANGVAAAAAQVELQLLKEKLSILRQFGGGVQGDSERARLVASAADEMRATVNLPLPLIPGQNPRTNHPRLEWYRKSRWYQMSPLTRTSRSEATDPITGTNLKL
jgi:hypothetical protein